MHPSPARERLPQRIGHFARGFLMGLADVIPGVSGGTVALILGIYTRLVDAIRSYDIHALRDAARWLRTRGEDRARAAARLGRLDIPFLVFLVAGIGTAVLTSAAAITHLLETRPALMLALFFGLILASARIPWRMIDTPGVPEAAHLATGATLAFALVGLPLLRGTDALWFVPVAGAIAICAMILPGISGAFLLVVLGMYDRLLGAIHDRDLQRILLFVAGAGVGLLAFSRLLSYLLHERRNVTLAFLTGLMLGSLRRLWPFKDTYGDEFAAGVNVLPTAWTVDTALALAAAALGVALVFALDRVARRAQPPMG